MCIQVFVWPFNKRGVNDPAILQMAQLNQSDDSEKQKESPKWDSNTRPAAYEADALPTELLRRCFQSSVSLFLQFIMVI